jgi:GntR family transcriptional regulator of arabinose operon
MRIINLKTDILETFAARELRAGNIIPSEHELAAQFDASRNTVRKVLVQLEKEGTLRRVKGKGNILLKSQDRVLKVHFIAPSVSHGIFPNIIEGIEKGLQAWGGEYEFIFRAHGRDLKQLRQDLKTLAARQVPALAYVPAGVSGRPEAHILDQELLSFCRSHGIRLLVLDTRIQGGMAGYTLLSTDHLATGHAAAQAMLEAGCERFVAIEALVTQNAATQERALGFLETLRRAGVKAAQLDHWTLAGMPEHRPVFPLRPAELARWRKAIAGGSTGFFFSSANLALPVLETLALDGIPLAWPGRHGVLAVDDLEPMRALGFSAIPQPLHELGQRCAQWFIEAPHQAPLGENEFREIRLPPLPLERRASMKQSVNVADPKKGKYAQDVSADSE